MNDPIVNTVGHVLVLDAAFKMPQLKRTRRIWAYLPPNYFLSNQSYPVIYMQDGQNLFDNTLAFSGEWGIDDTMESLFAGGDFGAIVIGIDNGAAKRLDEYSPWKHPTHGGGEGEAYIEFIVKTLKPYVDATFRTKADRENTAIGGSSMGGLISMYGGIKYQDVFSKLFVFSPSFWFSKEAYLQVEEMGHLYPMKIYLLGGTLEGKGTVVRDIKRMYDTLLENGFSEEEVMLVEKKDGVHSEWFWRREFAAAYKWLFDSEAVVTHDAASDHLPFLLSPTPFEDCIRIDWVEVSDDASASLSTGTSTSLSDFNSTQPPNLGTGYSVSLFNSFGQNVVFQQHLMANSVIDIERLSKGVYLLIVEVGDKMYRKKILKE